MPINPGDNLEPLMAGSGWQATQGTVDSAKVNSYAALMLRRNWQWLPLNLRNPILVDQTGKIMSRHHRFIAAQIASDALAECSGSLNKGMKDTNYGL